MLCCCSSSHLLLQPHPFGCGCGHGHAAAAVATTCASSSCTSSSSSSLSPRGRLHYHQICMAAASAASPLTHPKIDDDAALVALLRAHDTDAAYRLFASKPSTLPASAVSASRLLAQLSFTNSFSRAARLLQSLRDRGALHLLDANSLSLAAARSRDARLAHSLVLYMLRQGLLPDRRAYTAAVARITPPARAIRLFDAVLRHIRHAPSSLSSSSCVPDTAAFNAALSACADAGDCRAFRRLFDAMGQQQWKAEADAVTYNVVMKMCARAGRGDLLPRVLECLLCTGITPCATTFHSLVAALVGLGHIPAVERLVQAMRDGRTDICALLRQEQLAAAAGDHSDAHLLDDIVAIGVRDGQDPPLLPKPWPPTARVYTTLMKGYMDAGRVDDVVAVLRAMRREAQEMGRPSSRPDHVSYTTAISALVGAGEVERARGMLDDMAADGIAPNRVTYNVLLKGYCQQLQMGKARDMLRQMPMPPDVVTYNTLMDGCVAADDCAGALALFNEMRARGIAPSTATYTTLMKAFAASGQPRVAHKVFEEMERDPRVAADRAAWNMLVEAYCRQGMLQPAKQVVERMKARGVAVSPDVATYGSLAKAIAIQGKPGEALLLWEEVKEQQWLLDGELLGALADVCVRAGFFRKALEMVAAMEAKGIAPDKTRYRNMYVELHSRMFTSRHASQARQDRRRERKRAAEAFKFWLGLPNSYYATDWRLQDNDDDHTE